MMPRYAPKVLARMPESLRPLMPSVEFMYVALVVLSAIPIALAVFARRRGTSAWATYGLLLVAAVVLVNGVWHVAAAAWLSGYAPGVLTAVAVNLPVMATSMRWAMREGWLSKRALWVYVTVGVMLHGAGLLAAVAAVTFSR